MGSKVFVDFRTDPLMMRDYLGSLPPTCQELREKMTIVSPHFFLAFLSGRMSQIMVLMKWDAY